MSDDLIRSAEPYEKPAEGGKSLIRSAKPVGDPAVDDYGLADYAKGFFGGVNEGLAQGLGLPVDLANSVIDRGAGGPQERFLEQHGIPNPSIVSGRSEKPVGGSESIRDLMPDEMVPKAPDNWAGRSLKRIGEEIGASVPFAAAAPGANAMTHFLGRTSKLRPPRGNALSARDAGAKNVKTLLNATTEAGQIDRAQRAAREAAMPMSNRPLAQAGRDLMTATGAGVGAAVAREQLPGDPLAEAAGQLVGGVGLNASPTVAAARLAAGPVGRAVRRFTPAGQEAAGTRAAQQFVSEELTSQAMEGLSEAERLRQRAPGFNPSTGEASGSPSLLVQQRELEREASGTRLEQLAARRAASEQGIEAFRQGAGPAGQNAPDLVMDAASGELYLMRQRLGEEGAAIARDRQVLAGEMPKGNASEMGATMRTAIETARRETKESLNQLARDLGLDQADVGASFALARQRMLDMVGEMSGTVQPKGRYRSSPAGLPKVYRRLAESEGKWTLADVKRLREDIGDELREAYKAEGMAAEGASTRVRALVAMRRGVDEFFDDLANTPPLAGDPRAARFAEGYRQFRDAFYRQYVLRFEPRFARDARRKDGSGFYHLPDDLLARHFFKTEAQGGIEAARSYKRMVAGDPEAMSAYRSAILDDLHSFAVQGEVLDPKKFDVWRRRHAEVLKEFPEIAAEVAEIGLANRSLLAREAELSARTQELNKLRLTKVLDRYSAGDLTADEAFRKALGNPREMRKLLDMTQGDRGAQQALRRTAWEMVSQGDSQTILKAMRDYGLSLRQLFGADHLDALRDVVRMREMMERSAPPTGSAVKARPLAAIEDRIGMGIPQLGSRLFAAQTGRTSRHYLMVEGAMRSLRAREQAALDKAMLHALYDPRAARAIRDMYRADDLAKWGQTSRAERLAAYIMRFGASTLYRMLAAQTDEEDR